MILRRAYPTLYDTEFLLRLRNDPESRRMSRQSLPISTDDHVRWLASTKDVNFIAEERDQRIGVLRFIRHPHETEVSIIVAPEQRGLGYAERMLRLAADEMHDPMFVFPLVGYVRTDNERSQRAFTRAGWVDEGSYTRFCAPLSLVPSGRPAPHEQSDEHRGR